MTDQTAQAAPTFTADQIPAIRGALLRYRIMAYVVGVLLIVLVLVGMPLKYFGDNGAVVTWTGVPHGWLYMVLIVTAYDLGRRVQWPWGRLILIALAGTVPFLSFVAEHFARKDVLARIAAVEPTPASLVEPTPASLVEPTPASLVEPTPQSLVEPVETDQPGPSSEPSSTR